jgi:hypothetical protein
MQPDSPFSHNVPFLTALLDELVVDRPQVTCVLRRGPQTCLTHSVTSASSIAYVASYVVLMLEPSEVARPRMTRPSGPRVSAIPCIRWV